MNDEECKQLEKWLSEHVDPIITVILRNIAAHNTMAKQVAIEKAITPFHYWKKGRGR